MLENDMSYDSDNDARDFLVNPGSVAVRARATPAPIQIAASAIVEEPMPPESNVFAWQAWAERREPDVYGWKDVLPANPLSIDTAKFGGFPFAAQWNATRAEIVARLGDPVSPFLQHGESYVGDTPTPGNESWDAINAAAENFPPTRGWYFQHARGPGYFTLLRLRDAQGREVHGFREATQSTNSWHRADYITAASIVLAACTLGGASAGMALASSVVGSSFATAYPAVTAAIGNAAIGAVMNGGDVEAAVKGAVIGMAGGAVAGYVGTNVIDIGAAPAVGKAAGAVVGALVSGGDPRAAAVRSLLQSGVTFDVPREVIDTPTYGTVPDQYIGIDLFPGGNSAGYFAPAPFSPGESAMSFFDDYPVDAGAVYAGDPYVYAPEQPPQLEFFDDFEPGGYSGVAPDPVAYAPPPLAEIQPIAEPLAPVSPVPAPPPQFSFTGLPEAPQLTLFPEQPIAQPIPRNDDFSFSDVVNNISSAALKGLQLVAAYRAMNRPQPNPVARATKPDGSVAVAGSDGLVKVRKPDGTVTATKPAPGVPQSTVDGSIIVNNGDGSFTKISPAGASETIRYPVASGGGAGVNIGGFEISPLMLAGGAVAVFFLLRRK